MAIRTTKELMDSLKQLIGDSTEDTAISFLEDFSDTVQDIESRQNDTTDWKKKYEDNDAEWKKRYKERFFSSDEPPQTPPEDEEDEEDKASKIGFNDLFT